MIDVRAFVGTPHTYMQGGCDPFSGTVVGLMDFGSESLLMSLYQLSDVLYTLDFTVWMEFYAIQGDPVVVHWRFIGDGHFRAAQWRTGSYGAFRSMEPLDMSAWWQADMQVTFVAKPEVPMILFPTSTIRRAAYVWNLIDTVHRRRFPASYCGCRELKQFWHIWSWDYNYADPIRTLINLWSAVFLASPGTGETIFFTEGWSEETVMVDDLSEIDLEL